MAEGLTKRAVTLTWRPPELARFEPREVAQAAQRVVTRWAAFAPRPPDLSTLDETFRQVARVWRESKSLDALPPRTARWVPYVLFYPPSEPKAWIGSDRKLIEAYDGWIAGRGGLKARLTAASIRVMLQHYPRHAPSFPLWLRLLQKLLQGCDHPRLAVWKERQRAFGILNADGPKRVAAAFLDSTTPLREIAEDIGVGEAIESSAFFEACVEDALAGASSRLRRARGSADLERLFALIESTPRRLRFESLRARVGESLLLPWTDAQPKEDVRDALQTFLLRHLGDPRMRPATHWYGVSDQAQSVIRRWLVGATLEDFFRIIRNTAYERQWEYREAFWRAFLARGAISDAWVVFGPSADQEGVQIFERKSVLYGRLNRSSGVMNSQSVVLLRIGHLVIAEGSHNWPCHIWHQDDGKAPNFFQRSYYRHQLTSDPRYKKNHVSPETSSWQRDVAHYISRETGIQLNQRDWAL